MSMRIFLIACLLAVSVEASADRPDSDGQVTAINFPDSAESRRHSGVVRMCTTEAGMLLFEYFEEVGGPRDYNLVGATDDGTYVLHRVDVSDSFVSLHELLLLKPMPEAGALYHEKHHTLADRRYMIEKLKTIPVDFLDDAIIEIENNAIVVTIASP